MRINRERLWTRLQSLGGVGSDPRGGVSRFAWTPEYREACKILMGWMEEAGLTVRMDGVGNILGRMEGKRNLPAILTGSHFDTVPNGGRFDGMAGVIASAA